MPPRIGHCSLFDAEQKNRNGTHICVPFRFFCFVSKKTISLTDFAYGNAGSSLFLQGTHPRFTRSCINYKNMQAWHTHIYPPAAKEEERKRERSLLTIEICARC